MAGDLVYDALVDWARRCHASQSALPLPAELNAHRLERFRAPLSPVAAENGGAEMR
jgi:hypothetical protein